MLEVLGALSKLVEELQLALTRPAIVDLNLICQALGLFGVLQIQMKLIVIVGSVD